MITTCTECRARYQLEADKVPHSVIKVRCPECSGIFTLDGTARSEPQNDLVIEHGGREIMTGVAAPGSGAPQAPAPEPASAPAGPKVAVVDREVATEASPAQGTRGRRRRSKEEMYARALVSDIVAYNRDTRDQALKEGNLVEALGTEIKKSWELYKEKVTPEVANSTNHFKQALNEILAEGQSIF